MAIALFQPITFGDTSGDVGDHTRIPPEDLSLSLGLFQGPGTLIGDATTLFEHAVGGGNTVTANIADGAAALGDAITDHAQGGGNQVTAISREVAIAVGDALNFSGHAQGGDNTVAASGGTPNAYGDAETMSGHAAGGGNHVSASGEGVGFAFGDAATMSNFAHGGNNVVDVTTGQASTAYGDAGMMTGLADGGHNTVTGSSGTNTLSLYGDAGFMTGHTQGGYNTVSGFGTLYGDAQTLSGFAAGGHNTLIDPLTSVGGPLAPGFTMTMYGDGASLLGHATGGNNTLISGAASDIMWGDAATVSSTAKTGPNLFVFSPPNGHDSIMDFKHGQDHIELQGYAFTSFNNIAGSITDTAQGSLVTFDANDSILVANDHHLTSGDFFFV